MALTYKDFLSMVDTLEKNKVPGPYYIQYIGDGSPESKAAIRRQKLLIYRLFRRAKRRTCTS